MCSPRRSWEGGGWGGCGWPRLRATIDEGPRRFVFQCFPIGGHGGGEGEMGRTTHVPMLSGFKFSIWNICEGISAFFKVLFFTLGVHGVRMWCVLNSDPWGGTGARFGLGIVMTPQHLEQRTNLIKLWRRWVCQSLCVKFRPLGRLWGPSYDHSCVSCCPSCV